MRFKLQLALSIVFALICSTYDAKAQTVNTNISESVPETFVDIDGNTYHTVLIGDQVWMQENLRTRKYRNGKLIAKNLTNTQWGLNKTGACAVYDNDSIKENAFGLLYNWYAVANPAGLCPVGWHVPKDTEWNQMVK